MKATHRGRLMVRRILSVAAGLVAVVVLSVGTDAVLHQMGVLPYGPLYDTGLLLLATTYRSVYTVLGGYITAGLAPDRPMRHALALGVLGVGLAIVAVVTTWGQGLGPAWYPLALVALALPCVLCGGWLFELRSSGGASA
jgi:peptidoglycan/LPS O-acetylase OafA/YrhL